MSEEETDSVEHIVDEEFLPHQAGVTPVAQSESYLANFMPDLNLEDAAQMEEVEGRLIAEVRARVSDALEDPKPLIDEITQATYVEGVPEAEIAEGTSGVIDRLSHNAKELFVLAEQTVDKIGAAVKKNTGRAVDRVQLAATAVLAAGAISGATPPLAPTPQNEYAAAMADHSPEGVERLRVLNAEFEREQKRYEWHKLHQTYEDTDTLRTYFFDLKRKPGEAQITLAQATDMMRHLKKIVDEYPEEMKTDIGEDLDMTAAVELLQDIATSDITDIDIDRYDIKMKSAGLGYATVSKFQNAYADEVERDLRSHKEGRAFAKLDILKRHIGISSTLSDLFEEENGERLLQALAVPDRLYPELKAYLEKKGQVSDQLLEYFLVAGVKEAKDKVAHDIAEQRLDLADPVASKHSHFSDITRPHSPGTLGETLDEGYGIPRIQETKHVGEDIANEVLHSWKLDPSAYTAHWSYVDVAAFSGDANPFARADDVVQTRYEQNLLRMQAVERVVPGGVAALGKDYGIRYPARYPLQLLTEQLTKKKEGVPFGATLSAYADNNGGVDNGRDIQKVYSDAKANGLAMRAVEAGDPITAAEMLLKLKQDAGQELSFLGVRGHGEPNSVALGRDPQKGIITKEFFGVGPNTTSLVLGLNTPVYFDSCSTGEMGGIAQQVSVGREGSVVAPNIPSYIEHIQLRKNEDGTLSFDIQYGTPEKNRTVSQMKYARGQFTQ